jgi:hypothetical protein
VPVREWRENEAAVSTALPATDATGEAGEGMLIVQHGATIERAHLKAKAGVHEPLARSADDSDVGVAEKMGGASAEGVATEGAAEVRLTHWWLRGRGRGRGGSTRGRSNKRSRHRLVCRGGGWGGRGGQGGARQSRQQRPQGGRVKRGGSTASSTEVKRDVCWH